MAAFICRRCVNALARPARSTIVVKPMASPALATSKRAFSHLPLRRPQLFLPIAPPSRTATRSLDAEPSSSLTSSPILDLMPKISSHPALSSLQVRCGPRNTFNPSHRVRKRRHGFLSRVRTRTGRNMLKRRKAKGRWNMSH